MATILQAPILTEFLYPFLLIFFILFGLLEKTKIFGEGKTQLNAFISVVIGLIFVSAVFPKIIVENLMMFLAVGLVIIFVVLMLWGFVSGKAEFGDKTKEFLGVLVGIAVLFAVLWATGLGGGLEGIFGWLFSSNWSGTFWSNFLFVALIAVAVAVVIGKKVAK